MIFNRTYFPNGAPDGRKQWIQMKGAAATDEAVLKDADTSTRFVFTLSSNTPDMSNDIIEQDTWNLSRFTKSAPVLWAHNADQFPIGKWVDAWREGNRLMGAMTFAPTSRAQQARTLVETGHLKGVSVGFSAGEYNLRQGGGLHYTKGHTLLEASLCAIGCQPDALFRGIAKAADPRAAKAENLELAAQYRREVAAHKATVRREYEKRKAELAAEHKAKRA